MSKKISYRGTLAMGNEERISLATIKGKVGYRISKFQIISTTPGAGAAVEFIAKITKVKDPAIGPTVRFTDSDLLAVAFYSDNDSTAYPANETIIFDNEIFNQDIFVNITDADGGTIQGNYYIELERMDLSDLESTMLTLKNLREITSIHDPTPP
tara:strand:- start:812 stop:1276 length:465 start_codon:yes stop_codon:yes gene_type:complete